MQRVWLNPSAQGSFNLGERGVALIPVVLHNEWETAIGNQVAVFFNPEENAHMLELQLNTWEL